MRPAAHRFDAIQPRRDVLVLAGNIEAELLAGDPPIEVCKKYNVKYNTVKVHLIRAGIEIPGVIPEKQDEHE